MEPAAMNNSMYPIIDSTNVSTNPNGISDPEATTVLVAIQTTCSALNQTNTQAAEKNQQILTIALSVTLPAVGCFSLLALVAWFIRRRRSQTPQSQNSNFGGNGLNVKFYNRTLPVTPSTSDDTGTEYCVISNGEQVERRPVQSCDRSCDQACADEEDTNHTDESEQPATQIDTSDTVTYVVGEVECIEHDE